MKKILLSFLLSFCCFGLMAQDAEVESVKEEVKELMEKSDVGIGTIDNNSKEEDIRKLLKLMDTIDNFEAALRQIVAMFKDTYMDVPAEFWEEFLSELDTTEIIDLIIPIYEKHYTHEDIRGLIAFYQTPVGKKSIEVLPLITQESMEAGQEWGTKIGEKAMKKLQEKGY